jgi:hypothetical protein
VLQFKFLIDDRFIKKFKMKKLLLLFSLLLIFISCEKEDDEKYSHDCGENYSEDSYYDSDDNYTDSDDYYEGCDD